MKKTETKRYIAVVDYMTDYKVGYGYKEIEAKNLIEAMNEALVLKNENVYLVSIFEKQKGEDKEKVFYNRILTNRGYGWKTNSEGENEATMAFYYKWYNRNKELTSSDFEWIF